MGVGDELVPAQVASKEVLAVSAESVIEQYFEHIEHLAVKDKSCIKRRLQGAWEFVKSIPPEQWQDRETDGKLIRLPRGKGIMSFVTFLLLYGYLRPGYPFFFSDKLFNLTGESLYSPRVSEVWRFFDCASELGFKTWYRWRLIRLILILLIQTGKSLDGLSFCDLTEFRQAIASCVRTPRRYYVQLFSTQNVLYHLGILDRPADPRRTVGGWRNACIDISQERMRNIIVSFLEQLSTTLKPSTIRGYKVELKAFTKYLADHYPEVKQFTQLRRDKHIEPWLFSISNRVNPRTGKTLSRGYRIVSVVKLKCFFDYLAEWGWDSCPSGRLFFDADVPRREVSVPRFIPPEK